MKSYAFLDENNFVIEVCLFEDDNIEFIEQVKTHLQAVDYKSCEVYGATGKGADFYNGKFYDAKIFPSWVRNEELGKWEAPVPYPLDGSSYDWDEETVSWKKLD